jgi:hypothetical protein
MLIEIFSHSPSAKIKPVCFANRTRNGGTRITFQTDTLLQVQLGITYHVKLEEKEGQPAVFREMSFDNTHSRETPYIYRAKLGQVWSAPAKDAGSSAEETSAPDAKQKPDSP